MKENSRFAAEVNLSLQRYAVKDWGTLDDEDKQINEDALKYPDDLYLLASYETCKGKIWIITNRMSENAGDNATTVCFPHGLFRKVDIMAIVLTNGIYYIATSKKGGIIKTPILENAQTFYSVNIAMWKILKAPGKCKGYYPYDTEDTACGCVQKKKRRNYSKEEWKIIYNKSNGRCELCGKKLLFEEVTLDHIVPISMGVLMIWIICKHHVLPVISSRVIFCLMILWIGL